MADQEQKVHLVSILFYYVLLLIFQQQMDLRYDLTVVEIGIVLVLMVMGIDQIKNKWKFIEPISNLILILLIAVNVNEQQSQLIIFNKVQNILFGMQFQRLISKNGLGMTNQKKSSIWQAVISQLALILNSSFVNGYKLKEQWIQLNFSIYIVYVYLQFQNQNSIQNEEKNNQDQKISYFIQNSPVNENFQQQNNFSSKFELNVSQQNNIKKYQNQQGQNQSQDYVIEEMICMKKRDASKQSQKYSKFQKQKFNLFLFDQYQDGMIVLAQNQEIKQINKSLLKLLNSNNKEIARDIILNQKNIYEDYKEDSKYNELFNQLEREQSEKLVQSSSQNKNSSNLESNIIDIHNYEDKFRSVQHFVKDEYIYAISRANQQSLINYNPDWENVGFLGKDRLVFLYETKMLCQFGQSDDAKSDQFSMNDFDKQSIKKQSKMLEVMIKPFLFNNDPYVLIQVRDVTLFNKFSVMEQINKNRQEMLYQVAHEFRTPLNTIIQLSENQIENLGDTNEQSVKAYLPINSLSQQLLNYVNDLLDRAQLRAGKFQIIVQKFKLIELLNNIVSLMNPLIQSKGLYLNTDYKVDEDIEVKSDPNRIRQIIYNLVGNSFKFTQKGGITVAVDRFVEGEIYRISVRDTGIGIEQENQNKLFKAFGKIEDKNQLNTTGVGLGLMISHFIAIKLANKIPFEDQGLRVRSEGLGKGSEFSFLIESQNSQYQKSENDVLSLDWSLNKRKSNEFDSIQLCEEDSINCSASLQQKMIIFDSPVPIQGEKDEVLSVGLGQSIGIQNQNQFKQCLCTEILIIDDLPFNCNALILSLKKLNLKIDYAITFEQVKEFFDNFKKQQCCGWIRIILMDLEMPIIDGFQMTQFIRDVEKNQQSQNQSFKPSFIIGCSAHGNNMRQNCLNRGMDDFLTKPVKQDKFLKILQSQLELYRKQSL